MIFFVPLPVFFLQFLFPRHWTLLKCAVRGSSCFRSRLIRFVEFVAVSNQVLVFLLAPLPTRMVLLRLHCVQLSQARCRLHLFLVLVLSHQYHDLRFPLNTNFPVVIGVIVVSGTATRAAAANLESRTVESDDNGIVVV